jgi:hypothetical protein
MSFQKQLEPLEGKMRKSVLFVFLFLLAGFWAATGDARDTQIAVSPGSEAGAANSFHGQKDAGTEGPSNTFYGIGAGTSISSGVFETFIGVDAGHNNTTGSDNTFIGGGAGSSNTEGYDNTFIGRVAGLSNTTGICNTFLGRAAGQNNTTGYYNIFLGYLAGFSNTTGNYNTFIGGRAGKSNTTGSYNTFIGYEAGQNNTTGYTNTFLGFCSGEYNTTGNFNTFFGDSAGYNNTTGSNNTFLGDYAGFNNTTGNGNIFIGHGAGLNETGSNKLYIDNSNTSDPLIYGEFDNSIVTINGKLGLGTKTPGYPIEVVRTGTNASIVLNRTDGAKNYVNATTSFGNFGTVNNYPLRLVVNSLGKMTLNSDNSMSMASGATCTAGGVWTNASSIALKENISTLSSDEAATTLLALNPVKYNYKAEKEENHVGFIAEEVPELVSMKDRKSLSPMDIVAVLTKVTQDQQRQLQDQQQQFKEQRQLTQQQLQEQKQINDSLTQKMQEQRQINDTMKIEIAELKKKQSE